jgi:DNA-binding transcriptional LysR family regulator
LNTPLATVSRKISELESRLRTKLFDRTAHKLVLTGAGSSYVDACKRILADVTEAERTASGEYVAPTGELTVTAPVGIGRICLIPILADFFKAYPEIGASLIMTNRVLNLQQEQIDVGLRIGALPDSSIVAIRVGAVRRVVCASPGYLAARGTPRTPDDLAGHDCVVTFAGSVSPDVWTFVRDKTNVAVSVHGRLVVDTVEAARDAACAGIGIAWGFSYYAKTALERGALTTLLDEFQPAPLPVHLVYTANRFLPIKVRAFLDFAAPRLRRVLGE